MIDHYIAILSFIDAIRSTSRNDADHCTNDQSCDMPFSYRHRIRMLLLYSFIAISIIVLLLFIYVQNRQLFMEDVINDELEGGYSRLVEAIQRLYPSLVLTTNE